VNVAITTMKWLPLIIQRDNHHHHHHVTQSSHSINAIGPAPLWNGRKREHCSIMFATITHIPSLHKILSNTPRNHPAPPPTTPNIIRHKTQQLGRSIRQSKETMRTWLAHQTGCFDQQFNNTVLVSLDKITAVHAHTSNMLGQHLSSSALAVES
jgi:hypothetical protein